MISYATSEKNRTLRLNITSVSGYYNLFLQLNCPEEKRKQIEVRIKHEPS